MTAREQSDDEFVASRVLDWDRLVRDQPGLDDWVAAQLQAQVASGQAPKGVPLCRVARPRLVTAGQVASDQATLDMVARALVRAGELLLAERPLAEKYLGSWLTANGHEELLRLDPGYAQPLVIGRFDTAQTADGLQVLEYNGGLPGGMANTEAASALMQGWRFFADFTQDSPAAAMPLVEPAFNAMLSAFDDFGGTGQPLVVLAMPTEILPLAAAHLPGFTAAAARLGIEFVVADPARLTYAHSTLTLDGREVGLVIRGFLPEMLGMLGDRFDALRRGLLAGDVCMVASMRAGMYGHKGMFAAITDPSLDLGLSHEDAAAISRHVPWTRMARDESTTDFDGRTVDLVPFIASHRQRLVIKPANGFGGAGVSLGWEMDDSAWAGVTAKALAAEDYIVQDRIHVPTQTYPALEAGLPEAEYVADSNPIVCNGRIAGYFTRLSREGGVTNVSSGAGTLTPGFLISRPE